MAGKKKTVKAHNAQQRVQDALKRGEIKRPATCSSCGKSGNVQFAHSSYGGRLNGKWMCPSCHAKADKGKPKGGGSGRKGTTRA